MTSTKKTLLSALAAAAVIISLVGYPFAPSVGAAQKIGEVKGWGWAYMPDKNDQNDTQWQNASHKGNVGAGVGWIAFNYEDYASQNPTAAEQANEVWIDQNGYLHGWAYSEYIGWIQFDPNGPYPGLGTPQLPNTPIGSFNPGSGIQTGTTVTSPAPGSGIGSSGASINTNSGTVTTPPTGPVSPAINSGGGSGPTGTTQQSGWLPQLLQKAFGAKTAYAQTFGSARINLQTGEWSGWARAVGAINGTSTQLGGWDGWIALRGNGFGVQTNLAGGCTNDCSTTGHAWGDMVIGWISFANVKVDLEIDMCLNVSGNQATVPTNAIQVGTDCDFCSNISGLQASVPSGYSQSAWPNGQGFNCVKTSTLDPNPTCKTNPALCPNNLCPNIPPVPAGTTYGAWTAVPGQIIDPGTNYCILSGEICTDPAALNYGSALPCKYNQCDPETDPSCTTLGGKPIYEET